MRIDGGTCELMKAFRDDRLAKMDSGDIPVSMADGPATILHLLPASAFEPGSGVDLSGLARHGPLAGLSGDSWSISYDFEGVLLWDSSGQEETTSYVQLFRSGSIEIADVALLAAEPEGNRIDIRTFERRVFDTAGHWIALLRELGDRGPVALMLTLLHVRSWDLAGGDPGDPRLTPRAIDRDDLVVPEAYLEDLAGDPGSAFKNLFDPLWNAAGYAGSKSFAADGKWRG